MLSVVIPVYNVEAYLEKCIRSVARQTYRDLEIILINDGSTDSSPEICERWAKEDKRVVYISKNNEGSGETRNRGIRAAKGEYIAFLDSDDWWDETYAEKMLPYAEKAGIAVCDLWYVDQEDTGELKRHLSEIRMPDRIAQKVEDMPDLINRARTFLCGKIFRRELFYRYGIWQPTMSINDIPIVPLLVALAGEICRVGEPLYYYLRGRAGNTVTAPSSLRSFGEALCVMTQNFDRFGKTDVYREALKKMYFSQVRFAMRKAKQAYGQGKLSEEDYQNVKEYLFQVIGEFWSDWPAIDGLRFLRSDDSDVNQAIMRVLFDDRMLVDGEDCDVICQADEKREHAGRIVPMASRVDRSKTAPIILSVHKTDGLTGETLWWDMADQILFALTGGER